MKRIVFAVVVMAVMGIAHAQSYPTGPIRMNIPSTPGGGTDFIGRLMSTKLGELNGWTVVPENRPGAGTALGLAQAARSAGKGYDLVIGQTDNVTLIPLLRPVSYDPLKDLVPVALVGVTPMVLVVGENSPWKALPELIKAAKANPGTVSCGTSGTGGTIDMAMNLLEQTAGFTMQHVPYKGTPPALVDLVGGSLQCAGASISGAFGLIKGGKIRALAVTSLTRSPVLPDVPTVAELGYKGFSMTIFYGVLAPANTPPTVVKRLNVDFNKILKQPEVRSSLQSQGFTTDPMSPEEFSTLIASDIKKARQIIDKAGIKMK